MRLLGLRRLAEESAETISEENIELLQAYADGVNDCVEGTSFILKSTTSRLLPPEFYAFGLSKEDWRPWAPTDSIALGKYMSFYLSWNWMNDLARESLRQRHPDLADIAEELNAFSMDFMHDMVTIVDDDDLKEHGQWSEQTLLERYHAAEDLIKSASPDLKSDLPGATLKRTQTPALKAREEAKAAKEAKRKQLEDEERVAKEFAE